ncbi:MAG: HAMP domain-containing sensor histidine kinase [Myxococcota bacterium]
MDPARRSELTAMQWFLFAVTVLQPVLFVAASIDAPDRFDPLAGRAVMTALSGLAWVATVRLPWAQERAHGIALIVAMGLQAYIIALGVPNNMSQDVFMGIVMTTAVMVTLCRTGPELVVFTLLTVGGAALANELTVDGFYETSTVVAVLVAVIGAVGIMLYQRGRLERELAVALEDVRRLDATKSRVLHDLGNVANRLVGCCDELEYLLPDPVRKGLGEASQPVSEELGELRRTVDYIVELHTNVRGLHRESDGRVPLRSVAGALKSALSVARLEWPPHTRVEVSCAPNVTVYCDPTDLNRILVNLLINAGHAMAEAGVAWPALTVTVQSNEGRMGIRIQDNGPGIPPSLHEKVFEPRFTTRESHGGTGLGLAISRELATQNGGSLQLVQGAVGGAVFVVELPAGPDSEVPLGMPKRDVVE